LVHLALFKVFRAGRIDAQCENCLRITCFRELNEWLMLESRYRTTGWG